MRDDLTASEKRLIAALDRLDHFIDRAAPLRGTATATEPVPDDLAGIEHSLHAAQTENHRLSNELLLLHERHEAALAAAHERLLATGQGAARLAAANEALADANRALIAAGGDAADEARLALEAEIESLRATRAAEMAQMGDLLAMLDELIGTPAPEPAETTPARAAPPVAAAPLAAAVLEMPMPEQVTEFADAPHDAPHDTAGDTTGEGPAQAKERD